MSAFQFIPEKGVTIAVAAKSAIAFAKEHSNSDQPVVLLFNDLEINVYPNSYVGDIAEKYYYQHELRRVGN